MIAYNVIFIKDSEGKRLNESRSELDEKHLLLPFPSLERLPGEPEISDEAGRTLVQECAPASWPLLGFP